MHDEVATDTVGKLQRDVACRTARCGVQIFSRRVTNPRDGPCALIALFSIRLRQRECERNAPVRILKGGQALKHAGRANAIARSQQRENDEGTVVAGHAPRGRVRHGE